MSGAKACPIDGHRHSPVEWTFRQRRQFSCQGVAEPRSGVPGRAAVQASCRRIGRENATPVPTIPRVVTKSSPSSNIPITWALTRSEVRTKPGSNVDLRVHARVPLVRTPLEFERFDHVGSQTLYFSKRRAAG